jgi:hypothetical protein
LTTPDPPEHATARTPKLDGAGVDTTFRGHEMGAGAALREACVGIGALSRGRFDRERLVRRAAADASGDPVNPGLALRHRARSVGLAGYAAMHLIAAQRVEMVYLASQQRHRVGHRLRSNSRA